MAVKLGSIVVDLSANTVSFSQGMSKASQIAANSSRNIQRSLALVSTAATAMAAGIIASLTEVMSTADDFAFSMQKMAESTGTSVQMFSKLAYSAKLSGTPVEELKTAMERLAKTAGAARSGSREQIAAFSAIGISAKDLNGPLKDAGDLTVAVAKKMEGFAESTNKTALEQKLFGRSGAELAPLLKQLATGFDTASQEASLFGVVVGDKTAAQARELHEGMVALESTALGMSLRLLTGVAPALEEVSKKMLEVATSSHGMKVIDEVAGDIAGSIRLAGDALKFFADNLTVVKVVLGTVAGLQAGRFFVPLISTAAKAGKGMDDVGIAALRMVGNMSGITQLGKLFVPVITGAYGTVAALMSLATSEGIAAAGAYGLELALASLAVPLVAVSASLALLAGGVAIFGYAFLDAKNKAEQSTGGIVTWADTWAGALDQISDKMLMFKLAWDRITGNMDAEDRQTQKLIATYGLLGKTLDQAIAARAKLHQNGVQMLPGAMSVKEHKQQQALIQAPNLDMSGDKVDHVKVKLEELAAAAKAAQKALIDAGKGVDFKRADEIAAEYQKELIQLTASAKSQHTTLTDNQKAQLLASITTRVNASSQAAYRDEVKKVTDELMGQTTAQYILTQAIGMGASATRAAAIAANAAREDDGKSEEWKQKNAVARATRDVAFGMKYDSSNANSDKSALLNIQQQIDAQLLLNSAILAGKSARDAANLATEQANIRKGFADRGDTDTAALDMALAKNKELYDLKLKEQNLTKAASMNPAQQYLDEAKALSQAADAAKEAGDAIAMMQFKSAQKTNWDSYVETLDKAKLAVGSLSDGTSVFFSQMARQSESAAQTIHDVFQGAFGSLNEMLERLMSGQKANVSELFKGISGQIGKVAIQKGEQAISGSVLNMLGMGKKSDPTVSAIGQTNAILKSIEAILLTTAGTNGAATSALSSVSSIAGPTGAGSGVTSVVGSIMGALLPGFGFGGHRALGGDVMAGMTYDVGEMGREKFTPAQNGKITPNKDLGTVIHMPIDARGSNDPAQTEAAIHRAMGTYAPRIVSASVQAMSEQHKRAPSR